MRKPFFNFFLAGLTDPDFRTTYHSKQRVLASLVKIIAQKSPIWAGIWGGFTWKCYRNWPQLKNVIRKIGPVEGFPDFEGFFGLFWWLDSRILENAISHELNMVFFVWYKQNAQKTW